MNIQVTQKIRETSKKVAAAIGKYGHQTIRKIAEKVGCSKSAAHRHLQSQKRRNLHPEPWFWETEEGQSWLRLLIYGSLYMFGLQRNVGAEHLSEFFKLLRVDMHVGVSPSHCVPNCRRWKTCCRSFNVCAKHVRQGKEPKQWWLEMRLFLTI